MIVLALLMTSPALVSASDDVKLMGWVSDSNCGADHTKPGGKDCVEKCIKGGADIGHPEWKPQDRVFVEETEKKVWLLTNPDSLKGYEGDHVSISAKIQNDQKSLEVIEVKKEE
jgi:hypothetical protein